MFRKLICLLGFHKYIEINSSSFIVGITYTYKCKYCPKIKEVTIESKTWW